MSGWIAAILLTGPAIIEQIVALVNNEAVHLSGSGKTLAILGVAVKICVMIFRYLQSLKILPAAEVEPVAAIAAESAATPDGAQTAEPQVGV